jgi:hypothetical protein
MLYMIQSQVFFGLYMAMTILRKNRNKIRKNSCVYEKYLA